MRHSRAKIYAFIILSIFIFYITADYNAINIEKTALIVSLGIDKKEQAYSVTAQIAIPQASDKSAQNSESVITGEGETLYKAVAKIGEQTGWYPKMSFCNLIILGESVLEDDVMSVVDFFVRSYKVEDSSILCATKGSAKDLLASASPLDNISGFALSKIFVRDFNSASNVMTTTIKNFSIGYFSKSKSSYMPLVEMIPTDDKTTTADSGFNGSSGESSSGSSGSKQEGGSSGGKDKHVIYDASTSVLFLNGKKVGEIKNEEALFFSLLYKKVNDASFSIKSHDSDGKEGTYLIGITKATHSSKLVFENDKPIFEVNLDLWLKVMDSNVSQSLNEISNLGKLNDETLYKAKEYATTKLESLFNNVKESQCDLFQYTDLLYKYHNNKYEDFKYTIKEEISPKIHINTFNAS